MSNDLLSRRLSRLNQEVAVAAKAYLDASSAYSIVPEQTVDELLTAVRERDTIASALAAVRAVDDRVFDASGRPTGFRTGQSFASERGANDTLSVPQSIRPAHLPPLPFSRREQEYDPSLPPGSR